MKTATKITTETMTITPAIAKQLLDRNKKNRPLSKVNLRYLENELMKGSYTNTGESIKLDVNGNLLDGQHRLMSCVKTKIPLKDQLVVKGLSPDVFKFIDTGKVRTSVDALAMGGVDKPVALAAMAKFIINFKRGNFGAAATSSKLKVTNSEVLKFVQTHNKALSESIPEGFNSDNKLFSKSIVASLHYIFKGIDVKDADTFCSKLICGDGLLKTDSIYHVRTLFTQAARTRLRINRQEAVGVICKAWNHFRNGDKVLRPIRFNAKKEKFPKLV